MATVRPMTWSLASQTSPIPPIAIRESSSYRPPKVTPCVGRDKELALLEATLSECVEDDVARAMGKGTRWLTHREISEGCLRAAKHGARRTLVGSVEPWKQHPTY